MHVEHMNGPQNALEKGDATRRVSGSRQLGGTLGGVEFKKDWEGQWEDDRGSR